MCSRVSSCPLIPDLRSVSLVLCKYVIAALFAYFPKVCILHIFPRKLSLSPALHPVKLHWFCASAIRMSVGHRSFAVSGPTTWNSPPSALWASELLQNAFIHALKTHLSSTAGTVGTFSQFRCQIQIHWLACLLTYLCLYHWGMYVNRLNQMTSMITSQLQESITSKTAVTTLTCIKLVRKLQFFLVLSK